ncbi:MAG: alpha/beta hydrolase [Pseudomonadota bacterium]|nr:alpha/beta hydrolase [Pseudomonadota bacterium]
MNRRSFLLSALVLGLAGCTPSALEAAPFEPTRFSVQVRGTGPDVVLIPGLTSGRDVWNTTVRAVPGYRYHLIQVAGFSGEPVRGNADGPVVAPLADEIARYIVDRRLERPAIVGHSMGGTLAMMIGARHPNLAGRIMVVDMLPEPAGLFGGSAGNLGPLASRIRDMIGTAGGRQLFGSLITAFSPPDSGSRRSDSDVVGRAMQDLAGMDLGPQLPRIRAPLTVVYGSPDPQARPAIERTFTTAYARARGARLVRIDGSGHMVMFDQPARFQAALRDFLTR